MLTGSATPPAAAERVCPRACKRGQHSARHHVRTPARRARSASCLEPSPRCDPSYVALSTAPAPSRIPLTPDAHSEPCCFARAVLLRARRLPHVGSPRDASFFAAAYAFKTTAPRSVQPQKAKLALTMALFTLPASQNRRAGRPHAAPAQLAASIRLRAMIAWTLRSRRRPLHLASRSCLTHTATRAGSRAPVTARRSSTRHVIRRRRRLQDRCSTINTTTTR
ncbi:hypothetical protein POSPLADRAFT_1053231 [Postia placenta MAD-698-R-SB12]|uniref:Uncharacterized protein n=1 Tax=Postia placenta MAD-698-R-SB12 TaxID=670580 RepID=A0A1X6NDJ8_9APHY|nr:hypothetical protein POSPLADRAFT_1053231 [Postia placenta MAD-698-R-SB12]OSX66600.1 hypothetical protein POSPLADRAFT_1053231 [Postia placenta MAD-698-R-SB12]